MASKSKSVYVCSECGYETPKWLGKCPNCNEWSTLQEEIRSTQSIKETVKSAKIQSVRSYSLMDIKPDDEIRYKTGMGELDRVLGGGIVKGSLVLISGDPGIGKSTILLQICQNLGERLSILYVSGEESYNQIKLRADRLNVSTENLLVLCETDVQAISEHIMSVKPNLVIVDSIQTMNHSELSSSTGSVTQVRECTSLLMRTAKALSIPMLIVGHVNKDGNIAGPKVLEHIVDAVLYFEGERNLSFRILRAVKNRYGSTNEIGVFEMTDKGLTEVENPSEMLISGRPKNTPGTCVACVMEGTRPLLAEIQGLVTPTGFGNPRRMTNGFDYNRMAMLIAVLEKRGGYFFSNMDTYINVVGGMKLDEPALDLTIAMALVSSLKDYALRDDVLAFGEIGLAGEIRAISHCEQRVKEAARLGFNRCIIPKHNLRSISESLKKDIEIIGVRTIRQAFEALIL
ncbi:MAG: DNA repair protein RadA [Faecalibacterium sp.]|nr:DNA repair protein RadA [Ruminococcus sp.]MCM1392803.1 DNA repair protein RadA [Ruminococcus sp.]MCM1484683.1 DNA repair protein RadA [Faecalibacterium sp.]